MAKPDGPAALDGGPETPFTPPTVAAMASPAMGKNSMTKSLLGGLAVCAAALTLAGCNKPAETPAAPAAPAASAPAEAAGPAPAAGAQADPGDVAAPAGGWPADVAALKEKYDTCEHFAGEEPYDADRRKQIEDAIEANCRPVKNALPGLKAKYKDNAEVMALIKPWEEWLSSYE